MNDIYVINRNSNTIVNCISTNESIERLTERVKNEYPPSTYKLSGNPPQALLEGYRYYRVRPGYEPDEEEF